MTPKNDPILQYIGYCLGVLLFWILPGVWEERTGLRARGVVGFRVLGLAVYYGLGFRVEYTRVEGLGFRVWGVSGWAFMSGRSVFALVGRVGGAWVGFQDSGFGGAWC